MMLEWLDRNVHRNFELCSGGCAIGPSRISLHASARQRWIETVLDEGDQVERTARQLFTKLYARLCQIERFGLPRGRLRSQQVKVTNMVVKARASCSS